MKDHKQTDESLKHEWKIKRILLKLPFAAQRNCGPATGSLPLG